MKHIEYWIADDGKEFNNYFDCVDYEFQLKIKKGLDYLQFFDRKGALITPIKVDDKLYFESDRIIITNKIGLTTLKEITDFYGAKLWEDINDVGTWSYIDEYTNQHFEKIN